MKHLILCGVLSLISAHTVAKDLTTTLSELEQKIEGQIGVAIIDTQSSTEWSYHGNDRFPMMSTFKTLACANVLYDIEKNKLNMKQKIAVTKQGLINWNPITQNFVGGSMSLKSVCGATMLMSDNYAANLALEQVGGPEGVTQFLRLIGDKTTRLDNYEPKLNYVEKNAINDTTTPLAMLRTLQRLLIGDVLTPESKAQLKFWMTNNMVSDGLARSVLPENWAIADRSGGGVNNSRTLTAMIWSKERNPIFIGIFIANSKLSEMSELNKVVADISHEIFTTYDIK